MIQTSFFNNGWYLANRFTTTTTGFDIYKIRLLPYVTNDIYSFCHTYADAEHYRTEITAFNASTGNLNTAFNGTGKKLLTTTSNHFCFAVCKDNNDGLYVTVMHNPQNQAEIQLHNITNSGSNGGMVILPYYLATPNDTSVLESYHDAFTQRDDKILL